MPFTRSKGKVSDYITTFSNKTNIKQKENNINSILADKMIDNDQNNIVGIKRKADGRTVLGEVSLKDNFSKNSVLTSSRKVLSRINNKNIAAGAENIRNRRKELKEINTNISKNQNTHFDKSGQNKQKLKAEKALKAQEPILPKKFTGHDNFTKVELFKWQTDLKEEQINSNTFYDYEKTISVGHIESIEFSFGIFEYMKWREEKFEVAPYFDKSTENYQTDFKENDRRTLIDWMVEFQEIQETSHESLYLAVRLCDYFFGKRKVPRNKLQLYAFVGFLLATKFEERWPPTFEDMIYLSEDAYSKEDFIKAELLMLQVVDFDINMPISYRYLRRYAKCIGMDMKSLTVARFYLELTLMEYEYVFEKQSNLAIACLWVALSTLGYDSTKRKVVNPPKHFKKYWSDTLAYYGGVQEWDILNLVVRITKTVRNLQESCKNIILDEDDENFDENDNLGPSCKVIYKKYASDTFFRAATLKIPNENNMNLHKRRILSEKIDYEATIEPSNKRRNSGCVVKMQRMNISNDIKEKNTQINKNIEIWQKIGILNRMTDKGNDLKINTPGIDQESNSNIESGISMSTQLCSSAKSSNSTYLSCSSTNAFNSKTKSTNITKEILGINLDSPENGSTQEDACDYQESFEDENKEN